MNKRRSVGFTFIELLVVISVIGVISISGIAAFVSYDKSQKLNTAALDVVSMLNLAKSRAQTQVKPEACTNPDPDEILYGYEVVITINTVDYELNVRCEDSLSTKIHPILSNTLPNNYSFSASSTISNIFFPVLKGGVEGDYSMLTENKVIIIDDGDSTKNIQVDTSGNITIQ